MKDADRESSPGSVMADDLASGVYRFLLVSGVLLLVVPLQAVAWAVAGILWLVFGTYYLRDPKKTILVFVPLVPVVYLLPAGIRLLPGANFETVIVPALAGAAYLGTSSPGANRMLAPSVFFALVMTVSAVLSHTSGSAQYYTRQGGWQSFTAYEMFSQLKNSLFFVFLAPLAFRMLTTPGALRTAVRLVAGVSAFLSIHSLLTMWTVIASGDAGSENRAISFLLNQPNLFGGFLALMLCIQIPVLIRPGPSVRERAFFAFCCGATAVALVFTFSRGSWLAFVVGLGYLAAMGGKRTFGVVALLAATATIWVPQSVLDRVQYTFQDRPAVFDTEAELEASAQVRLVQWGDLPGMWIRAPLIGHGFNSYQKVSGRIARRGFVYAAHSSIITLTVEQGTPGLIAYAWLLGTMAFGAWRLRGHGDPLMASLATGFLAALISLVVLDLSGNRFLNNRVMVYLWVIGGGIVRLGWELQQRSVPSSVSARPAVAGRRRQTAS